MTNVDISKWTTTDKYGYWVGIGYGETVMSGSDITMCSIMYTNSDSDTFTCTDMYANSNSSPLYDT